MSVTPEFADELVQGWQNDGGRLYRQAYRLTRNRDSANDLIDDTLERALQRPHRYEPGTNMTAWLSQMMVNVYLGRLRGPVSKLEARSDSLERVGSSSKIYSAISSRVDQVSYHCSAEEDALDEINNQSLEVAIDTLPPPVADTVRLASFGGLKYKEISDVLGIPVGTVCSRLFRARRRLGSLGYNPHQQ